MSTSTINWYVSSNGSTWTLCSTAGICNPVLTLRTNGMDELVWQMPGDFLASPAFAYGSTIYLARGVTTDGTTVYTCRFIGRITSIPRQAASAAETLNYKASGGWWWLEQVTYAQRWQNTTGTSSSLVNFNIMRVVLGQTDDTVWCDAGTQVKAAVQYAIAVGAPIALGTVDTGAMLPYSEHICIRCADVIRQCLRLTPDVCCWFEYSTGTPVFNCRQPSNLTTKSIAVLNTDTDTITMTPRYDLLLPGVLIMYEQTNVFDGKSYRNILTDAAGSTGDPRVVGLYFEMSGSSATTVKQEISVADYPAAPYTDKAFWRAVLPWLDPDTIADADLAIQNVTRDGVSSPLLPSYLTDGQVTKWMTDKCGVNGESETWEADISYKRKTSGTTVEEQVVNKHVSITLLSTDGTNNDDGSPRTYSTLSNYTAGEPITMGLAAQLYASWSRLQWDGSFRLVEDEASFQAVPGNRVNITGGLSDWSAMLAIVQDSVVDLNAGTTSVTTGTCGRLEADSLVALYRAAHFRQFSQNFLSRDNAESDSNGDTIEGGKKAARKDSDSADPGQAAAKRWTGTDSGSRTQVVVIDPGAITFGATGDAAAKTLALREIRVLEKQGDGSYKAKLVQALCSPVYDVAGGDVVGGIAITGMASGDMIQYNGSAWVKVTPVQVTYVTDVQLASGSKQIQKKTRTGYLVSPGTESGWTMVTGGQLVQGVTA